MQTFLCRHCQATSRYQPLVKPLPALGDSPTQMMQCEHCHRYSEVTLRELPPAHNFNFPGLFMDIQRKSTRV
jgi:hypothetical protein